MNTPITQKMALILSLVVATCLAPPALVAQTGAQAHEEPTPEISWNTDANGKHYVTTLKISRLVATPNWTDSDEHPPLSPRKALAAARKVIDELEPYGKDAQLNSPTLKLRDDSSGHWFWVVYFSPNDFRRFQSTFPVVVLMDGSTVQPARGYKKGFGGGVQPKLEQSKGARAK
ncbi:hypothetical protein [Mariniblastus fucicola]|uniref:Uncharacterized protein n=1 Tax=Mariniblastus fucicola TaxID=980251 RepID=A0A5B9P5M0_9BACT|nr:hypothetical protein [Mariniblastus fucicola]QEG21688.1 hypothetical protein MFFC18_15470 [Mariniblastus fucicola]